MPEPIIDLTKSDDEVVVVGKSAPTDGDRPPSGTRRGRSAGRHRGPGTKIEQTEISEDVQRSEPVESSRKSMRGDKESRPKSEQSKSSGPSNGSASLLSRLGTIVHENEKNNKAGKSNRSKRGSRDRPPAEGPGKTEDESLQAQTGAPRRSSPPRSPKEVPLSELPVDQLFFIDTGPGGSPSQESSPLGTGSTTPNADPGIIPSAKSLKRKLAKERKKEKKLQAEGKVPGDTPNGAPNEVEFVGGSALVVEDQAITSPIVTQTEGAVVSTTSVTDSGPEVAKQAPSGTTVDLSLPAHVTVWTEGDPDPSEDASGALEPEDGVEYLDYEDDQATGVPRYFAPESATGSKKVCRTCGEEGHIAKFCKKLICLTCGERDDHDTRNCPMRVVCFNCGGKGHLSSTCPQPRGRPGCDRCGSSKHIEQRCPEQFKTYVYLSEEERLQVLKEREALADLAFGEGGEGFIARHKWCYNCGGGSHWGDDCKDSRPFSMPTEPCAFGSFNASRGPFGESDDSPVRGKDPRPAWMDDDPHLQDVGRRGKEANMRRNQAAEASRRVQEREEDDWFSRTAGTSRDRRPSNDRGSRDNLPPKPKFSFQSRDDRGESSYRPSKELDTARDRNRDRKRDKDRDYDRRKRGRDYEDEPQNHRRRDYDGGSRRKPDSRDRRDDDRRGRRHPSGGDRRGDGDRYRPQYGGSYA